MADDSLSRDRILDAAEEVLRRYGPAKTTVQDVARALNVSHASLYRYFENKAALRDAVTERWLHHILEPLTPIVESDAPADIRLRQWVEGLSQYKRQYCAHDPELFATYTSLAEESREVIQQHVEHMLGHLTQIISQGVDSGVFRPVDPVSTAAAVLTATSRFHHPAHAAEWQQPNLDAAFDAVWDLLARGLKV